MDPNFPNPSGAELRQAYKAVELAENLLAETRKLPVSGSYLRDTLASGYWSPQVFRIFGLDRAEEAPPIDVWISMVLRPDAERTAEAAQRAFRDIASIAAECGFFDQSHFTREFRKKFGITPGEALRRATLNR
jgi:AraC-like DNA-binding protein